MFKKGKTRWTGMAIGAAVLVIALGATATIVFGFTAPNHVTATLEGCRNDGSITLPNGDGDYICPDGAYTTGNLGKGWNELDLVPHRITMDLGSQDSATTDYNVYIAGDYETSGKIGWDVISVPVVNTSKSDASCSVSAGPQSTLGSATTPFGGGTDVVIYRLLTIHQAKGTTCVFDYYQRLALGAHLYPGSSLQSYLGVQDGLAGSKKTISIPVNQIQPQELDKDMSATQGTDHVWDITKSAVPATLSFANTCAVNGTDPQGLELTINWTKGPADPSGPITVITHVYATNPAARTITTNVTDVIYSGTTPLDTASSGPVDVPANTTLLVLTHTFLAPDGTSDLNDIASATYTDKVTGIPVPGTSTATASADVQLSGPELNQSATINDEENITGSYLTFSADSFTPDIGDFDDGYVAGTETIGPVSWTSDSQSGDGSVTFSKKVYVSQPAEVTGTLSDTATLTGSDGFSTDSDLDVEISTYATVSLTINKTIDVAQATDTTFTFKVLDGTTEVDEATVTIKAGETSDSTVVSGLTPGVTYTIDEIDQIGWKPNADQTETINLPSCSGSVDFANTAAQDLTVSKTAVPSFTRTYAWDISKDVDKTQINIAEGGLATFNYTVDVTHDGGTDSLWKVDGIITVSNPNDWLDIVADVTDSLPAASCNVTGGDDVTVPKNDHVDLPYSCTFATQPAYDTDLTNTATATWDKATYGTPAGSATGSKVFQFTTPTTIVDGSVTVSDDLYGALGTVYYTDPSPKTFTYQISFEGEPGTCTDYKNTASIETSDLKLTDSDSETVTVCVGLDLTVTKTAAGTFDREYLWKIEKGITDPSHTQDVPSGTPATFHYEVTVTQTGIEDSGWELGGTITISNPNDWEDIEVTSASDVIDNGGTCSISETLPVTVGKSGTATLHYTCTFPVEGPSSYSGNNTATVGWDKAAAFTPDDSAATDPTAFTMTQDGSTNKTVTVYDDKTNPGSPVYLGEVTATDVPPFASQVFTYSLDLPGVGGTCTDYKNIAKIEETGDTADETVTVCVGLDLTVSKDVTPYFTRTFAWGIEKLVDKTSVNLEGTDPQSATFNYTVKVTHDSGTDSDWYIKGTITISNPNDWEAIDASVSDAVDNGGSCALDDPAQASVTVPAKGSVDVDYTCTFTSGAGGKNTATATWDAAKYATPHDSSTGSASFAFTTPTTIINGSVTAIDDKTDPDNPVELGTASYDQANPIEFKYSLTFQGVAASCQSFTNTAWLKEFPDTKDSETVEVCASVLNIIKLTQGAIDPSKDWQFQLFDGPHADDPWSDFGSALASDASLGKLDGILKFGNYNIDPDKTYTFCELNAPAGWASLWSYDGSPITPYNPDRFPTDGYPYGQDLGKRCFDFGAGTAYAIPGGGKITFTVDNRFPGGEPRTIGFWKNWATCTGGGQALTATKNAGYDGDPTDPAASAARIAAGYYLLDDVLNPPGITLGSFTIPASDDSLTKGTGNKAVTKTGCQIAVDLLDKTNWYSNKKAANDAAYGLAAQLLAAKANITAGAKQCPALNDAVLAADALLTSINFDGTGDYLGPKVKGALLTQRNSALSLADTLDKYNNGLLCP